MWAAPICSNNGSKKPGRGAMVIARFGLAVAVMLGSVAFGDRFSAAAAAERNTIRYGIDNARKYRPAAQEIAQREGFFAREGLNVSWSPSGQPLHGRAKPPGSCRQSADASRRHGARHNRHGATAIGTVDQRCHGREQICWRRSHGKQSGVFYCRAPGDPRFCRSEGQDRHNHKSARWNYHLDAKIAVAAWTGERRLFR